MATDMLAQFEAAVLRKELEDMAEEKERQYNRAQQAETALAVALFSRVSARSRWERTPARDSCKDADRHAFALEARIKRMELMLREIEWIDMGDNEAGRHCPNCFHERPMPRNNSLGHANDCELGAILGGG